MSRAPLLPLRDFFDDPVRTEARISPDGKRLAYLAPLDGRLNVWVRTVGQADDRPVTADRDRSIAMFRWLRDGRRILHAQDRGGDENFHLFVTDATLQGATSVDVTPFDGVRAELVALPRNAPATALVALNRRDPTQMDVWRLDLDSFDLALVATNPGNAMHFVADRDGRVRVCRREVAGGHHELLVATDDGGWRVLCHYDRDDRGYPLAVTPDGTGVWVNSAKGSDLARIVRLDLDTGTETLVDAHDEYDFWDVLVSDRTGELLAAIYRGHEGLITNALDDGFAEHLLRIGGLHDGDPMVVSADADETAFVVRFDADRDPGVTYLYRLDGGHADLLYRPYPRLRPADLAAMTPLTVTARDGLVLRCYVTLPVGADGGPLPTVFYIHGGPWDRDSWGYHPVVQALANRGFAVVQVNFRGSVGFGKSFVAAGEKEWGGRMHDDVLDVVDRVVADGIADPQRLGIAGASYGGYEALVAAAFTPEVFAAHYSIVGPSNLLTVLRSFPPYWKPLLENSFYRHCGHPDDPADATHLRERSPLFRADRIRGALGITQTVNDPRVPKHESDQIVDALRARGVDVDYLVIDGEGHGFQNAENRLRAFQHMDAFFTRHLGGRTA